jgi:hypothetical protein
MAERSRNSRIGAEPAVLCLLHGALCQLLPGTPSNVSDEWFPTLFFEARPKILDPRPKLGRRVGNAGASTNQSTSISPLELLDLSKNLLMQSNIDDASILGPFDVSFSFTFAPGGCYQLPLFYLSPPASRL